MTVSCPDCRSVFRVDPSKVPAAGVRARCSVCGGVITIAAGTLPTSTTPVLTRPAQGSGAHQRPFTPPTASPAVASPAVASRAVSAPAVSPTAAARPAGPIAASASFMTPPVPTAAAVGFGMGAARTPSHGGATSASDVRGAAPNSTVQGGAAAAGTPKRPINPFLNADPGQRAKRLARALVSDLVAYHPQKREDGLRDGTLRQLFREEIKKSYEEYLDQVGRELADGSPYFQDALNDILGNGRKLF